MEKYVKVKDAIDVFQRLADKMSHHGKIVMNQACSVLEDMAPAEVKEIRRGEWVPVDEKYDAFDCSCCNAMVSSQYLFCPRCGADMTESVWKELEE